MFPSCITNRVLIVQLSLTFDAVVVFLVLNLEFIELTTELVALGEPLVGVGSVIVEI